MSPTIFSVIKDLILIVTNRGKTPLYTRSGKSD
jgi:hypothetical protein